MDGVAALREWQLEIVEKIRVAREMLQTRRSEMSGANHWPHSESLKDVDLTLDQLQQFVRSSPLFTLLDGQEPPKEGWQEWPSIDIPTAKDIDQDPGYVFPDAPEQAPKEPPQWFAVFEKGHPVVAYPRRKTAELFASALPHSDYVIEGVSSIAVAEERDEAHAHWQVAEHEIEALTQRLTAVEQERDRLQQQFAAHAMQCPQCQSAALGALIERKEP